ncbi:MAG: hypothetical protein WB930_16060 [Syntrophobacteraceae bacterium]
MRKLIQGVDHNGHPIPGCFVPSDKVVRVAFAGPGSHSEVAPKDAHFVRVRASNNADVFVSIGGEGMTPEGDVGFPSAEVDARMLMIDEGGCTIGIEVGCPCVATLAFWS